MRSLEWPQHLCFPEQDPQPSRGFSKICNWQSLKRTCESRAWWPGLATIEVLILAKSFFCDLVIIESDNFEMVKTNGSPKWGVATIVEDIMRLKRSFPFYEAFWSPREANSAANDMTKTYIQGIAWLGVKMEQNLPMGWVLRNPILVSALVRDAPRNLVDSLPNQWTAASLCWI